MPMISGSTPAKAKLTSFILGVRPSSFAAAPRREDRRGRAVVQAGGVAGGDAAVRAERRLERGEALERGLGTHDLVAGGESPALLGADGDRAPGPAGSCPASYAAAVFCWLAQREAVGCAPWSAAGSGRGCARRSLPMYEGVLARRGVSRGSAGWGRRRSPSGGGPCARRRRRWRGRSSRSRSTPAIVVAAVIAPAHMRSIAKPGTVFGQAGEDRGRASEGQALVARLGRGRDRDVVDAVLRHVRVALEQSDHRLDDEVVGPGVPVHALFAGSSERGADPVDEHDFSSFSHAAAPYSIRMSSILRTAIRGR